MTLVVGILCSDGVVVAADSAATYGASGQPTIAQAANKIEIIEAKLIIACSGVVGLSQRFHDSLSTLWKTGKFSGKNAVESGPIIGEAFKKHLGAEMNIAQVAKNVVGMVAISNATCLAVVAMPLSKTPALIHFNELGGPEVASPDLQFIAIGSGQLAADPFLAFLRDRFWPSRQPTLAEGKFAAYWTLHYAISHSPGGLAHPIHVAILEQASGNWHARLLTPAEIEQHQENIEGVEKYLSEYPTVGATSEEDPMPTA